MAFVSIAIRVSSCIPATMTLELRLAIQHQMKRAKQSAYTHIIGLASGVDGTYVNATPGAAVVDARTER